MSTKEIFDKAYEECGMMIVIDVWVAYGLIQTYLWDFTVMAMSLTKKKSG